MSQVSISYNGITRPEGLTFPDGFSGSASFESAGGTISQRVPGKKIKKLVSIPDAEPHIRKANKSKISKKIKAYTRLEKSKKFLAFYTITFPAHLPDSACYKSLNIVLTRMRKIRKNFTYLWVAERQKNGTIHYHMLTNCFFNIRLVNHFASCAIRTQIYTNKIFDLEFLAGIYNGVDVKRVYNPEKVGKYISKYVTKNDTIATNAVWHCSREVSALFTSYRGNIDLKTAINFYLTYLCSVDLGLDPRAQLMKLHVYAFSKSPPQSILSPLDSLNEAIYSTPF